MCSPSPLQRRVCCHSTLSRLQVDLRILDQTEGLLRDGLLGADSLVHADGINRERRPVGLFLKSGKTAQLRSKTASSSTTQKVEVFLKGEKGSTSLQNCLFDSAQLCSRSYFAVTSQSLRSHFAVTTRSLRGHYGHYAVTTRSLRSLRSHYGHYAVRKSTYSRLRKRSTSFQNGHCSS